MISVIDMPPPEESIWWRGKRGFEVGFFPCECVEVIGDKVPHGLKPLASMTHTDVVMKRKDSVGSSDEDHHNDTSPSHSSTNSSSTSRTPSKPVLRKHGKLISFFRSFILSRPTRGKLKKSGILKERVFGCDLSEHLLSTGQPSTYSLPASVAFTNCRSTSTRLYVYFSPKSSQALRRVYRVQRYHRWHLQIVGHRVEHSKAQVRQVRGQSEL